MSALPGRRSAHAGSRLGRLVTDPLRIVLPLAVVAAVVWLLWGFYTPPKPAPVSTSVMVEEIRAAAKLATVELHATVVTNRDESAWYGSRFLFQVVPGRAAVGFDLANWQPDSLRAAEGKVTVTLPAPEVLYVDVDLDKVETYNNVGLLRPQFTPEETQELLALARRKIAAQAGQQAIMDQARTKAADLVKRLAMAAGATDVVVEFAAAPGE
jgi:hypothetical protein